jgi:hypothetical protein
MGSVASRFSFLCVPQQKSSVSSAVKRVLKSEWASITHQQIPAQGNALGKRALLNHLNSERVR